VAHYIVKLFQCMRHERKGFMVTSWILLTVAIPFEVSGTTCIKLSLSFTKLLPSIAVFVFYGLSFTALTLVLKNIDVSLAYAVWSGLGTAIIAVIRNGMVQRASIGSQDLFVGHDHPGGRRSEPFCSQSAKPCG